MDHNSGERLHCYSLCFTDSGLVKVISSKLLASLCVLLLFFHRHFSLVQVTTAFVEECLQVRWVPLLCVCKLRQSCKLIEGSNCQTMIENFKANSPIASRTYPPMKGQCAQRTTPPLWIIIQPSYVGLLPNGVFSLCVGLTENLIMWCSK